MDLTLADKDLQRERERCRFYEVETCWKGVEI